MVNLRLHRSTMWAGTGIGNLSLVDVVSRMDGRLGCRFVGRRKKTENVLRSSSPSCSVNTVHEDRAIVSGAHHHPRHWFALTWLAVRLDLVTMNRPTRRQYLSREDEMKIAVIGAT
jgi:hypothetical protein